MASYTPDECHRMLDDVLKCFNDLNELSYIESTKLIGDFNEYMTKSFARNQYRDKIIYFVNTLIISNKISDINISKSYNDIIHLTKVIPNNFGQILKQLNDILKTYVKKTQ